MGRVSRLVEKIRRAVREDRFLVSYHADERRQERVVSIWQIATGFEDAAVVRERPTSRPYPSVVVRQFLPDETEVEVIRAWLSRTRRANLATVFFPD